MKGGRNRFNGPGSPTPVGISSLIYVNSTLQIYLRSCDVLTMSIGCPRWIHQVFSLNHHWECSRDIGLRLRDVASCTLSMKAIAICLRFGR
ncbi:hypothetical protein CEXT_354271 [Caerostris extrusa]|uniref:Uncharacterized protein n=1 Tax=Caerostris extrusa TaxID=172846 RepID=A0AAV4N6R6_CAEEX|nr:hypothetical protein CEXT_354271 [Caerostris extrusa]